MILDATSPQATSPPCLSAVVFPSSQGGGRPFVADTPAGAHCTAVAAVEATEGTPPIDAEGGQALWRKPIWTVDFLELLLSEFLAKLKRIR